VPRVESIGRPTGARPRLRRGPADPRGMAQYRAQTVAARPSAEWTGRLV